MHILLGLLPYTRENLQLTYRPNQFFNELERISGYRRASLQTAMWRAKKRGLIEHEGTLVKLTAKGLQSAQPFVAQKLGKGAQLMVVFDIPEESAAKRRRLREVLRDWHFEQVQKSVWVSSDDYRQGLIAITRELGLEDYVKIYGCELLFPTSKH